MRFVGAAAVAVASILVAQEGLSRWMSDSDVVSALLSAHGETSAGTLLGAAAFLGMRLIAMFGVPLILGFVAVWTVTKPRRPRG
jgi:hypothetical protein